MDFVLIGMAAIAAGASNALAGGGTLITFPTMVALGIPPVSANVTNTVALLPGYLGGFFAQLKDIRGQQKRLWIFLGASIIGGFIGGLLLLKTEERAFEALVPYLILLASSLLAVQGAVRARLAKRSKRIVSEFSSEIWAAIPVGLAAIYGGYFGAGMSVVVISVLGLVLNDTLTRLNAVKQAVAFGANSAAAVLFLFSGKIVWLVALVMAACAFVGGILGGRLAGRIKPDTLRWTIVTIGLILAVVFFLR